MERRAEARPRVREPLKGRGMEPATKELRRRPMRDDGFGEAPNREPVAVRGQGIFGACDRAAAPGNSRCITPS